MFFINIENGLCVTFDLNKLKNKAIDFITKS